MTVEQALIAAGEAGAAAIWRTTRRDLSGALRLGVLARDPAVAARLAAKLDGGPWAVTARAVTEPTLGLQDDLLRLHAVIWATPAHAPLPAAERALLDELTGAPAHRAVVIADLDLLEQISDDPTTEANEITERIARLLPSDWPLEAALAPTPGLAEQRTRDVATLLITAALERTAARKRERTDAAAHIDQLLQQADRDLAATRRDAARVAAHVLSAMRRHTEQLLIDVRDLLVHIETDLPAQIHAVDDLDLARRALPHWLQHILDQSLDHGLSSWRVAVLADLAELDVDDEAASHAELLLPTLHPPPFARQAGWGRRIALTAALGGAAVLAAAGLWAPTVLALGGSLAWSSWARDTGDASSRDELIDSAREALRGMGRAAERVLNEQIESMGAELHLLEHSREQAAVSAQAEFRRDLEQALAQNQRTQDELDTVILRLQEAV